MTRHRVQSAITTSVASRRAVAAAALAACLAPASDGAAQVRRAAPRPLEPAIRQVEPAPLGDPSMPPWVDAGDVPLPAWARSVAPNRGDAALYAEPGSVDARRGSALFGARLPIFAARRAPGCQGRWIGVGPLAWICSDVADYSGDGPGAPPLGARSWEPWGDGVAAPRPGTWRLPPLGPTSPADDGLPYRYYFAGANGAFAFSSLSTALDDAPMQELEQGFAVAIVEEQSAHGEAWGKTTKGRWIALRELVPARAFLFHGEVIAGDELDVAWIVADKASVFATDKPVKAVGVRARFEKVRVLEEKGGGGGAMVRVEGAEAGGRSGTGTGTGTWGGWMRGRDLGRARAVAPPLEVGAASAGERWVDVDLAQQTLVAYEGTRPVFATLVSTGRGPQGSELATPIGVHRIWVKIFTTKMGNLEKEDVEKHYALEDVPWVQFFDKAVGFHGTFWHRDLGHIHSHGCVNLAPLDARWLYAFTSPHLPAGWTAVYPTRLEPGTVVRVR